MHRCSNFYSFFRPSPIIIMFKEVKIQYTINLLLLRPSSFFQCIYGMKICDGLFIFREIKKKNKKKIAFDPLSFDALWIICDRVFLHFYDCQYETSMMHKKIKVLFWFIFNFTDGHSEHIYLKAKLTPPSTTMVRNGIWNPFFSVGVTFGVSKS